ncbi:hypothetical protein BJX64DRAFT_258840 [Aspergillus heterothallicus]
MRIGLEDEKTRYLSRNKEMSFQSYAAAILNYPVLEFARATVVRTELRMNYLRARRNGMGINS